jgi:putative membrane protein
VALFGTGLVTLIAVLVPPFEGLAERRLWAHMVQHVTVVAVAAPLLVLGNASGVLIAGLPPSWRERWPLTVRPSWLGDPARATALAAVVLVAHTGALWAWHLPALYEPALRSAPVHALEHASLFATALLFWLVVAGSRRRAASGAAVLVTFVAALQGSALGALITLAGSPWYPTYAEAATGSGLTPLEDQQLAGVVMWGPCGAIYTFAGVLLFADWIRRSEREGQPAASPVGGA